MTSFHYDSRMLYFRQPGVQKSPKPAFGTDAAAQGCHWKIGGNRNLHHAGAKYFKTAPELLKFVRFRSVAWFCSRRRMTFAQGSRLSGIPGETGLCSTFDEERA